MRNKDSKAGRVRCGACQRVLEAPDDRRTPTRGEQAAHDAMPSSVGKGRHLYEIARPAALADSATLWEDRQGIQWRGWHCACGRDYSMLDSEWATLRTEAKYDRGEDLFLTAAHLRR